MIDVVVPVFTGKAETICCIEAVLACRRSGGKPFELIIIDDASPDPDIKHYLSGLKGLEDVTLLANKTNIGFVASVNRGMSLHPDRDVVLLNSDTEVAGNWLDRLHACAYRESNIGTVTPFSNNATICSFPMCCENNSLPDGIRIGELDAVFAAVNAEKAIDIPTAVGFCMYVRRDCLDAVGLFDEQLFGRGYGEENDFCRRAVKTGWRNVLAADTFVFHAGSASFGAEREVLVSRGDALLAELHPEYHDAVREFVRNDPAAMFRRAVEIRLARMVTGADATRFVQEETATNPARGAKSVQLHVVHDLGGGVERWLRDYCGEDRGRNNLVLRPLTRCDNVSEGLMLYARPEDDLPISYWQFEEPIEVATNSHAEYKRAVEEVIADHGVSAVLVSSLIGHSLDVLSTGLPTVLLAHDYFPACPAINTYYHGVCRHCDYERMADCSRRNPDFNAFPRFSLEKRSRVRDRLLDLMANRRLTVVTPSRSVQRHFLELFPEVRSASWVTIPHGVDTALFPVNLEDSAPGERLRLVVLGALSASKGMQLLLNALDAVTRFADIYLVGVQEVGELFLDKPGVYIVERYSIDELQGLMQDMRPHAGLLLSIWPETYSYTLTELMRMGIPPVVTRVGAFAERVFDGETGFIVDPCPRALTNLLEKLDKDRAELARIRSCLTTLPRRTVQEMVADYRELLSLPDIGNEEVGSASSETTVQTRHGNTTMRQVATIVGMAKQIKHLELQLAIVKEARPRPLGQLQVAELQRQAAERQRDVAEHQRAVSEHQRTVAEHGRTVAEHGRTVAEHGRTVAEHGRTVAEHGREVAEHQRAIAEQQHALAASQFEHERQQQRMRLDAVLDAQDKLYQSLEESKARGQSLEAQLEEMHRQVAEIYATTSWRVTLPIRTVGRAIKKLRAIARVMASLFASPSTLPNKVLTIMYEIWRARSLQPLLAKINNRVPDLAHQNTWAIYRETFRREVAPRIQLAITTMPRHPLISVVVPTYNTHPKMLTQMLDSVAGQIYQNWELCVADDCSTQSAVAEILRERAASDPRVKIDLATSNRGVSHASNRAIKMATGEFVVLLDHDDILEPQALYRVAQSVISDNPDMVYSDEILLSQDLNEVLLYAFRPAFSLEFLRSHPYCVHMVGFRAELLREIGGFDESLKISQDYDLILRISERAKTIVHIPEILYQWRIHPGSAGTRKMMQVMATSKAVLSRHLERCGEKGEVRDGIRFNLFDIRYPLVEGLSVAIVIPTKNHGELVKQCVDSIHATVGVVNYRIVVVDHDSDDPDTLAYLASLLEQDAVTVLRYSGPFNFSAINNWAIHQLKNDYSHYLLCNNDIEALRPGWLERMLELGQHEDVGIVGAQLLYPDKLTLQHAGVCVGAFGAAEHYGKFIRKPDIRQYPGFSEILQCTREVSAVTAACLLIRRDAFEAVGGFDEALAVGFGDVDLCLRVGQQGYRILQCPHAELLHHESFTRGKTCGIDPHPEDSALFQSRWAGFLHAGDPYFHPNLNQNSVAWQIRSPLDCNFELRRRIYRCEKNLMRIRMLHSE